MHHCMWWEGPCAARPLPTPTSTGHYLCEQHIALATARMRDATATMERATAVMPPTIAPLAPTSRSAGRKRPLGRTVPPIIFALVLICTAVFPFRFPLSHLTFMFFGFLTFAAWWGWVWGMGKGRQVPPGRG